jgi:hypothetical protein
MEVGMGLGRMAKKGREEGGQLGHTNNFSLIACPLPKVTNC